VFADGAVVGRIMKVHAGPVGTPLWTLTFGHHGGPMADALLRADARGHDGGVRAELAVYSLSAQIAAPLFTGPATSVIQKMKPAGN
jgi:hypothetical protein